MLDCVLWHLGFGFLFQDYQNNGNKIMNKLKNTDDTLGRNFVRVARANWGRHCISDSSGKELSYGQTLISAFAIAEKISKMTIGQENVGIILPPSVPGALVNLAVTLAGKVAVNLNYTASASARKHAVEQCRLGCIISSRQFLEKASIDEREDEIVFIEDIIADIGFGQMAKAYFKARFTRAWKIEAREIATIIFSSGTTGKPKGVMLSHDNILSNIEAIRSVIDIKKDDNLCAVLPFFHSFGFMCGLWLPLIAEASSGYIAKGFDGAEVGQQARKNSSTILFAPPTFLSHYVRRTSKDDFATLRLVFAGAEKLKQRLAEDFEAKFGIRPLEGYGMTELSPVVSLNLPGENKEGTVGKALPGVSVKIVDEHNGQVLAPESEGLVMVKGPNVMVGYLNMPKETDEVLKDGWYNTGDLGCLDSDGFLKITDRLSRFSKIAGEMVGHLGIENVYLDRLGMHEQVVAVTSVPDEKKGEELVVLYVDKAGDADKLHQIMVESNLPNMWKPRRSNYIRVESMPAVGSGKLNTGELRNIALAARENVT